jgi:hypothetical protein
MKTEVVIMLVEDKGNYVIYQKEHWPLICSIIGSCEVNIMRIKVVLFFVIYLCSSCSVNTLHAGCMKEIDEALDNLEKNISEEVIVEGAFRDLEIGQAKEIIVEKLKEYGVNQIRFDVDVVQITASDDLYKLKVYSALKVGGGSAVIQFHNDQVSYYKVAPIFPDWEKRLNEAKNKEQVFDVLSYILLTAKGPYRTVENYDPDTGWVKLDELSKEDKSALESYNQWRASFQNSKGFWHLTCYFTKGRLNKIRVQHSPVELF